MLDQWKTGVRRPITVIMATVEMIADNHFSMNIRFFVDYFSPNHSTLNKSLRLSK
jgi:hypothetical protein